MKSINFLLPICLLVLITGCAGPRYSGSSIPSNILSKNPEIVLIDDNETRQSCNDAIEAWFKKNQKTYVVKPEGSKHPHEKITIEYVAYWKWDLALYLSAAELEAYHKGQKISTVEFRAPNSLNLNKFGSAEDRIHLMVDIMFGKKTAAEATKEL